VNDTTPAARELMRELLMRRSGPERLLMGFDMYDSARTLLEAGLCAEGLVEGTVEWRRRFLQRMYGGELGPDVIERIAASRAR
jgi:hypothetical protein